MTANIASIIEKAYNIGRQSALLDVKKIIDSVSSACSNTTRCEYCTHECTGCEDAAYEAREINDLIKFVDSELGKNLYKN